MVGLLSGMGNVRRASVRRGIVCRGYVLGEVSVGLLSGRATLRESLQRSKKVKKLLVNYQFSNY